MSETPAPVRIYLCCEADDLAAERELLRDVVLPELFWALAVPGLEVTVWDAAAERAPGGQPAPRPGLEERLRQIDACGPFFVGLLGERCGESGPAAVSGGLLAHYPWMARQVATGASSLEIELEYATTAVLPAGGMRRGLLYFRAPTLLESIPEASRRGHAPANEAERERMAALKQRLREGRWPVVDGYPCQWDAERQRIGGLQPLGRRIIRDLAAAVAAHLGLPAPQVPGSAPPKPLSSPAPGLAKEGGVAGLPAAGAVGDSGVDGGDPTALAPVEGKGVAASEAGDEPGGRRGAPAGSAPPALAVPSSVTRAERAGEHPAEDHGFVLADLADSAAGEVAGGAAAMGGRAPNARAGTLRLAVAGPPEGAMPGASMPGGGEAEGAMPGASMPGGGEAEGATTGIATTGVVTTGGVTTGVAAARTARLPAVVAPVRRSLYRSAVATGRERSALTFSLVAIVLALGVLALFWTRARREAREAAAFTANRLAAGAVLSADPADAPRCGMSPHDFIACRIRSGAAPWVVQVKKGANAPALADLLTTLTDHGEQAFLAPVLVGNTPVCAIEIGPYFSRDKARLVAERMASQGFHPVITATR